MIASDTHSQKNYSRKSEIRMNSGTTIANYLKKGLENEKFSFFFACICIFLIPLYTFFIPPFMILWLVSRMAEVFIKYKKNGILPSYSREIATTVLLFMIFFLAETATLLYTENLSVGFNIVFSRLSLLVFPLLFIFPGNIIAVKVRFLTKLFAAGAMIYVLYCFLYAAFRSISFTNGQILINTHPPEGYWMSYFFGSFLSLHQHPSYASVFIILSFLISIESIYDSVNHREKTFWIVSAILLLCSIYFFSSRAGFIIVFLTIPIYFFTRLQTVRRKILLSIILIALIISGLFAVRTNERIDLIMDSVYDGSIKEKFARDGRILIWRSSFEIIKKNPVLGVGIGDVRPELAKVYETVGDEDIIKSRYNAHNQFLETALEGGFICLGIFLTLVIYLFYMSVIRRNLMLLLFLIVMIVFFMFETVLYRLAGVSLFSVFSFLLLYYENK